ncbi:Ribokinase-like protein [Syncephalis fuscata]|nr:Ribokinase-like protein [Syncephalis fuscata]
MDKPYSIMLVGAFYVDTLLHLAEYPAEDSKVPSLAIEERRGGNGGNSATVLAQFPARCVFLVSSLGDVDKSQHYLNELAKNHVDTEGCAYRPGLSLPSAMVLISRKTNTRTIISYRRVPELTLDELQNAYRLTFDKANQQSTALAQAKQGRQTVDWVHLEGRNVPTIVAFAKWLRALDGSSSSSSSLLPPRCISQEFESPGRVGLNELLPLVDVALFSRLYAEKATPDTTDGVAFLKHISQQCRPGALLFCTWGEHGAYSCQVPLKNSGVQADLTVFHTPARQFDAESMTVVDPVGAGDTFTAGVIHRLVSRLPSARVTAASRQDTDWLGGGESAVLAAALTGCNLAGRKVVQMGFNDLGKAWLDGDAPIEAAKLFNQAITK